MKWSSTHYVHDVRANNLVPSGGQRRWLSAEAIARALLGLSLHASQCLSIRRHVAVARAFLARESGTPYLVASIVRT